MVGVSLAQVSTCPSVLSSTFITNSHNTPNFLPCLPLRSKKKLFVVKSTSSPNSEISQLPSSSEENKNLLSVVLNVPQTLWKKTIRPLMDFGFGKRSIWEGGVGLFIISGTVLLALSIAWLRGFQLRSRFKRYSAVFEFAQASGICTGTPVRIRGVTVGNVVKVNPSLRSIEAVAEIEDDKIIIPRNSLVEVNQSGLLMETMIDITPRNPIPTPSRGPLDQDCVKESLILCDKQKMKGNQGVSLDELVGIFTRIGREVEEIGVSNTYALAQRVASVIEEAKPLLIKVQEIAEDVQPLLAEVHNGGLLNEVQSLTKSLTEASKDLRRVQSSILTPENTELIRKSIYSLIFTLKNIENISSDILGFTGDEATRRNLKLLIKSLSRLI